MCYHSREVLVMNYIVQICTGGFDSDASIHNPAAIGRKLDDAIERLPITDVIVGWNQDKALNEAILSRIHHHGKKAWLWLPVFAEMPEAEDPDLQRDASGLIIQKPPFFQDESFQFSCPTSPKNRQIPVNLYQMHFSSLPFDGVFLDRIRQDSFGDTPDSVLGCLCERCTARFASSGVDVLALRERLLEKPFLLVPTAYEAGRYRFDDPEVDAFFKEKTRVITESVAELSAFFRGEGLSVGLDVFAPVIAPYTGQEMHALAAHADFIKPMLYRVTHAPAGLPHEVSRMAACIQDASLLPSLQRIWGAEDLLSERSAEKQFEALRGVRCGVYPGFEINTIPGICESSAAYAASAAALYARAGAEKAVLSWNLLENVEDALCALQNK